MPDDVDRGLLERFVRGDPDAFESLFKMFERHVFSWILRIVRDPAAAEDALIEAFWRAYRGRARFDVSRNFGAWMRRIATNAAVDQLHQMRRAPLALDSVGPVRVPPDPAPADAVRDAVRRAFRRLPPRLQLVAVLALVEGESHASIADALDLPIGTVKSRVFRATRALRKELERAGITT